MDVTRRSFVKAGLVVSGCASLCGTGCGNDVNAAPIANVTVDDDSTSATYGKIAVVPAMFPELVQMGGSITLHVAAIPAGTRPFTVPPKGILLLHRDPTDGSAEYVATRSDCPHQGCPLGYSLKDDRIECPCHGSRFLAVGDSSDPTGCAGLVVHPPAKSNLTVYNVDNDGSGTIYVDLNTLETCGTVTGFPSVVNGRITFTITDIPALATVGGSIIGKPAGLSDTIIIARTDETTVITLSDLCTHQGCPIALDLPNADFLCPCHGSRFRYDGSVVSGSQAKTPVKSYATTFDGTTITITAS